jgi:glycerophosphoryl diester phosphodiesterase
MFVRLKKFMFKNKVLTYARETFKQETARLRNYPYRLPHGQENNEQSWLEVSHPQIEKSPLHIIAKAIGRVSLSPVEMTKEYLTNPNAR